VNNSEQTTDLYRELAGGDSFDVSGDSTLAKLDASSPTYEACQKDTRYTTYLQTMSRGEVGCFKGRGYVVGFTLANSGSGYSTLNLTIWQGPPQ
jgi:hypothetical protein